MEVMAAWTLMMMGLNKRQPYDTTRHAGPSGPIPTPVSGPRSAVYLWTVPTLGGLGAMVMTCIIMAFTDSQIHRFTDSQKTIQGLIDSLIISSLFLHPDIAILVIGLSS